VGYGGTLQTTGDPLVIRSARRTLATHFCVAALAAPVLAAGPDWDAVTDVEHVWVISQDEDGDSRETKIWLAVVDGQGFIRTGGSSWGDNLEREPEMVLRVGSEEYPLRADFIEDDDFRVRIEAAFREKYGWSDGLISIVRGSRPRIMHMAPR